MLSKMVDYTVDCLALMFMVMSPPFSLRHKHKHKKNGSVRFSYAYAYVLVKTRLYRLRNAVIGGFQPISRDTDDNGETNKMMVGEQKGLMRGLLSSSTSMAAMT